MNFKNIIFYPVFLASLFTGVAYAVPKNGFSLNAGTASHNRDCNGCTNSKTSGLSIGMDYQFSLSNNFSISPFLMSSSETASNVSNNDAVGHGILGGQIRYWVGDVFIGAHLGRYSEALIIGNTLFSGAGGGTGLVAGWEAPDSGVYVMGQFDSANVTYPTSSNANINFTALRLSLGYRWK